MSVQFWRRSNPDKIGEYFTDYFVLLSKSCVFESKDLKPFKYPSSTCKYLPEMLDILPSTSITGGSRLPKHFHNMRFCTETVSCLLKVVPVLFLHDVVVEKCRPENIPKSIALFWIEFLDKIAVELHGSVQKICQIIRVVGFLYQALKS
jgi:hypothetical protein